ncbi:MAG TPA: hypothetical protein VGH60_09510 [Solirubrobacteraceae bacterium]|jgi:hypothetical protein
MEIRSYRAVFDLERRIYRIDRLRLNPAGVPVRGIVYFLALLATIVLCARTPALRAVANALPWYLVYVALPGGSTALLTVIAIDGRPAHLAAQALLRYRAAPRHSVGLRAGRAERGEGWRPPEILLLPDGSDACVRRLRYTGPGAVLVRVAHERSESTALGPAGGRSRLTVRELPGGTRPASGQVIALAARARLFTVNPR